MCLIAFAINASPRWSLVVASNRDEFFNRPTLALSRWKTASGQEVISGRDLRAGGTWLGVTPSGRVGFLTNVRDPKLKPALLSRGELVTSWLGCSCTVDEYSAQLQTFSAAYDGFNLVLGDLQRNAWKWMTNRSAAPGSGWHAHALSAGVYGLSNASLDTPWPKTLELKRALSAALLQAHESGSLCRPLWSALASQAQTQCAKLPGTSLFQFTEPTLSSAFVNIPPHAYGTRSSTVLVVRRVQKQLLVNPHRIEVEERTYTRGCSDEKFPSFSTSRLIS